MTKTPVYRQPEIRLAVFLLGRVVRASIPYAVESSKLALIRPGLRPAHLQS